MGENVEEVGTGSEQQCCAFKQAYRKRAVADGPENDGADSGDDAGGD